MKDILSLPKTTAIKLNCNGEVHYTTRANLDTNWTHIMLLTDSGDRIDFPIANTILTVFKK